MKQLFFSWGVSILDQTEFLESDIATSRISKDSKINALFLGTFWLMFGNWVETKNVLKIKNIFWMNYLILRKIDWSSKPQHHKNSTVYCGWISSSCTTLL